MTASILDGKLLAEKLELELQQTLKNHIEKGCPQPGLAVICIGEDKASHIYVHHKRAACQRVGIQSFAYDLPTSTAENDLIELIEKLNHDSKIHGILVQLPLPQHINQRKMIEAITPHKDVDGFHPYNLGRLAQGEPLLRPCTPYGIIQLLNHYQLPIQGQHAVVIGVSNIVGRPMGLELLLQKATVTLCHRQTTNLKQHVQSADILIVATGVPDVVPSDWLKQHQIVIDVGIHRTANNAVRGDMDYLSAKEKVSWITPVPKGVGPMTVLTLLQNTIKAAYL